jgi:hypothetical protein
VGQLAAFLDVSALVIVTPGQDTAQIMSPPARSPRLTA